MANVKIANLPATSSLVSTDVLPSVSIGSDITYKITVKDLSDSLTQVSSSISASYATTSSYSVSSSYARTGSFAVTASYVTGSIHVAGNLATSASYAITASYALNGGGGGSTNPGGSNTQIQYNNSNAFGGVSTATFDGTTFRATGSFSGSLTGNLTGTASYVTGSIHVAGNLATSASYAVTSSYALSSSYAVTSSFVTSASFASTSSYVNNLNQNVFITGSLIVSGTGGAGIFSQGATLVDAGGITTNGSYTIWRAPFSCSVVGIYGYQEGGTTPKINAAKSSSAGYQLNSSTDVTLTNEGGWYSASAFQFRKYGPGDSLRVVISGSSATLVTVQVDFIKIIS